MYGCRQEDVGTKIRIDVGDQQAAATIPHAHDPMPAEKKAKDRKQVRTSGPVPVMTWSPLKFEPIDLEKGQARLVVRAVDLPAQGAFEVKEASIRRVD